MVLIAGFFIGTLGVTVSVVLGSFIVNTIRALRVIGNNQLNRLYY
jgi:hypothetical protein